MLLGLTINAWITIAVILTVFLILLFTKLPADFTFLGGMCMLYLTGVLSLKDTFAGCISSSVMVIGFLFIVIAGLVHTGVLRWIVNKALGQPKSYPKAIVKLMLPVAALSAFLSNAVIVALFVKVVRIWSKKLGTVPSKLLIPLSYASGMGGICTLIGTPPNLIISSAFQQDTGIQMSLFTPLIPGLFCLAVGILSMLALRHLLPERTPDSGSHGAGDFVTEMYVKPGNPNAGHTLESLGLYNHPYCKIVEITRNGNIISSHIEADELLLEKDIILVAGNRSDVLELKAKYDFKEDEDRTRYSKKALLSSGILIAMVALAAFKVLPLMQCCIIAAFATLITRCCTVKQARETIEWDILAIFSASIAFGTAIEQTGLATLAASGLTSLCGSSPLTLLIVMCLFGTFATEFISNTACAAIMYPIAYEAAVAIGANPMTFAIALMIAVSSSFATPIGSPPHMLVYTPGGYKFSDFLKVGIPMNFIILAANIFIVTLLFPL